jgi:glycogen debranching enzyme
MGPAGRDAGIGLQPHWQTLILYQGRLALVTGLDGMMQPESGHGFFASQTCLLGAYGWRIDGREPLLSVISPIGESASLGYYLRLPEPGGKDRPEVQAAQQAIDLQVARRLWQGWHEDIQLTNLTQAPITLDLALHLQPSRAWQDLPEAEALGPVWQADEARWHFRYTAAHAGWHIHDGVDVWVRQADGPPRGDAGAIRFAVSLAPGACWRACLDVIPTIDGQVAHEGALPCTHRLPLGERLGPDLPTTRITTPDSETLAPLVQRSLDQARQDLIAMRLPDLDQHGGASCPPEERPWAGWTVAAGVPTFMALFGRDTLAAAWQAALMSPDVFRGTLPVLAEWQGCRVDDWRDEDPGRMLHEAQTAPEARLGLNPRARYYGSITTSGFYAVAMSEMWHWTGDRALTEQLAGPAVRALRWLDRVARADDGFYYYQTRSSQGQRHQAWKDSDDAMVDADGRQVDPPLATCEEQGFVYLAKVHLAEVLWRLGDYDSARSLWRDAQALKQRFNEAFWLEDAGFIAMALDIRGRPVASLGSNPGHCLATDIVARDRVRRVADRLMAPDLFSGWGIRTLSTGNPAYNPYSYQRGSIWPVEQATFAIAFMRYGLHDHLHRLSQGFYEAASLFALGRPPELYGGQARDAGHPFPALVPQANAPQAWSASAVFCVLQALLGLYPYAPSRLLVLDPHLPPWLPAIKLEGLRVGDATVSLAFSRHADGRTGYRVLAQDGDLHILHQPSPWSLTASAGERLWDLLAG